MRKKKGWRYIRRRVSSLCKTSWVSRTKDEIKCCKRMRAEIYGTRKRV